jgi:hypothetical protein
MAHWHQLFPGRILDVHYEGLLANQEEETRNILEYCELPFEEACLNFHKTERTVKTASFLQVRQPIYQTSKGRSRHYMAFLDPLRRVLAGSLEPENAPVTIGRLGKLL